MKEYRLSRLLRPPARRGLHLALEYFSAEKAAGAEGDLEGLIAGLAEAAPEALHLSIGQADILQALPIHPRPALVLRADVNNLRGQSAPRPLFSRIIENAVEQALRLDAAGVLVSLLHLPGEPELTAQCLANLQKLRPQCERWCMPLMVDVVAAPVAGEPGPAVAPLVREAGESGADLLKVDLPEDLGELAEVVQTAGAIPVLIHEDRKAGDREILSRARTAIRLGASGIVGGRNLSRHGRAAGLLRALSASLHEPTREVSTQAA